MKAIAGILFSFLLVITSLFAQESEIQTLFLKKFYIDSVQSFNNRLVYNKILQNIQFSDADLEIRKYQSEVFAPRNYINIHILRFKKSELSGELVEFMFTNSISDDLTALNYVRSGAFNDGRIIYIRKSNFKPNEKDREKIFELINNSEIFTTSDQSSLIDSARKSGLILKNPCYGIFDCFDSNSLVEIKLGNWFRNLFVQQLDYYQFPENRILSGLKLQNDIDRIFKLLFQNPKD